MVTVISLGGSIVAPDDVDTTFLADFSRLIRSELAEDEKTRFILVVGGGGPARRYQQAYRQLVQQPIDDQADWIGIMATRLNAQLLRAIFSDLCPQQVVIDPTEVGPFVGRILVAAGWKPGFSTDYDAVLLAERFQASRLINLSNIQKVYTDDPRKNPEARPIDAISWDEFLSLVGDEWVPGKNVPFDPVASRHAKKLGLEVICAAGKDLENLRRILHHEPFVGTTIGGNLP
ncbi:MAG: UMP kinase [Treponemataceae bacterium]|uniref:UMP kinase n=1 Tax=Treponema sp. J25 TaxID=2094121 RepID=UPI001044FF80|nr:UMP kinase [Treponema sp. J25]MCX7948850.1 UMP kinase [Treponemataceae bacterium]HOJ99195.1 UMP kinase [Termitinemataceae bacterium]TCW61545.1 UMP kinase [Treponema sp. J25]HOM23903.1 UMP kinase [Termitinemataceae bacterium]HPQ00976.1 UMP kinase [Termitinemataceae bacterium]